MSNTQAGGDLAPQIYIVALKMNKLTPYLSSMLQCNDHVDIIALNQK